MSASTPLLPEYPTPNPVRHDGIVQPLPSSPPLPQPAAPIPKPVYDRR